ncbi:MAG: hypothetical protein LBJ63_10660 [Prevotellaceae bacterium]|jgi:hypothetical protein|nr:hypothetical protein [Prevotellaceae bacterium]
MKKTHILFLLCLTLLCSCATRNYLNKTVWLNVTPVEKDGVKGNILTSVYFWDKNTVSFYTAVEKDNAIIVKPVLTASGNYNCKGNLKKGIEVMANMVSVKNETLQYKGFLIPEGMVLVSPDSTAKGYNIITDLTIK